MRGASGASPPPGTVAELRERVRALRPGRVTREDVAAAHAYVRDAKRAHLDAQRAVRKSARALADAIRNRDQVQACYAEDQNLRRRFAERYIRSDAND